MSPVGHGFFLFIFLSATQAAEEPNRDIVLEIKVRMSKNRTIKETFVTNVREKSVVGQFQLHSGLLCYVVYDFRNEVKIFKVDVLGEPELGQKQYQSMCFVTKLNKNDIIPTDAMSRLRQKSSGAVQEANDILKPQDFETDVELINIGGSQNILGEKFDRLCSGHESVVYAKESELLLLAKGNPEILDALKIHVYKPALPDSPTKCSQKMELSTKFRPCSCKIPFTIAWFPCVVKYCSSKNQQGETVTTRCGIRSCRVTYYLGFIANHPLSCQWGVT